MLPPYSAIDLQLPPPAPLYFRYEQFMANTDFEPHRHPWGQINRISLGLLELVLDDRRLIAPADYLVWVPAEMAHAAHVRQAMDHGGYRHVGELSMRDIEEIDVSQFTLAQIQQLLSDWQAQGLAPVGIEIDHDAGSARLPAYGAFLNRLRQALPALFLGTRQRRPTAVDIGAIGLGKAVRGADLPRLPAAALAITAAIQRR